MSASRTGWLFLATVFAWSSSGSAAAARAAEAVYTITIENMQFSPSEIAVHPGDRVLFKNKDLFPHTATADGKLFDSQAIAADGSWSFVASKPGTYRYSCTFHATMKGKLTVR